MGNPSSSSRLRRGPLLFGDTRLDSEYTAFAASLVQKIRAINDAGRRFVIWATCLGFEGLVYVMSDRTLQTRFVNNDNISLPLYFNRSTPLLDGLFDDADRQLLATRNLTYFHHRYAFLAQEFEANAALREQATLVATGRAPRASNVEFVAVLQFTHYPFFACQFHPEKVQFETNPTLDIALDEDALRLNRKFGQLIKSLIAASSPTLPLEFLWNSRRGMLSALPLGGAKEGFYFLPEERKDDNVMSESTKSTHTKVLGN